MRTTFGLAMAIGIGALGLGLAGARLNKVEPMPAAPVPAAEERLIVHEWGTFTSFSGSDGVQLKFRPLTDQLPPFIERSPHLAFRKDSLTALVRMETPVTYFYTDRPRQLDVRVGFPQGLLTEFYPPAKQSGPRLPRLRLRDPTLSELSNTSLSWRVKLHPDRKAPTLPPVKGDDHYGFARATDSAVVEVVDSADRTHCEKFLFYRGVGDFSLPLRLEASTGRRFRAINDAPEAIESLFLVMIDDDGLRFCQRPNVAAHAALELAVPDSLATADELSDRMAEALTAAGLYKKESRAMVQTWRSSWFNEPGARLFYIVPRRLTDEIIPLTVRPSPDKVVRVLVGRMEVLTPEATDRLVAVLGKHGAGLPDDVEALQREARRLGRFAEPTLSHVEARQGDLAWRQAISQMRAAARRAAK